MQGGRRWRPGSGHRDTSGSGAAERWGVEAVILQPAPPGVSITTPPPHPLTMHAACTASERLAALGSHQNMWQQKEAGPAAMMNANVWTSLPTARKERKRTRHSPSTASVWREETPLVRNSQTLFCWAHPSYWRLLPSPPSLLFMAKHCHAFFCHPRSLPADAR